MNDEKILYDYKRRMPLPSVDEKTLKFIFRKDISDEKIKAFLDNEEKKLEILEILEKKKIPYEVKIFLNIPYSVDDEQYKIDYDKNLYIEYTPSANLASAAPPYNPENNINYNLMNIMNINDVRTLEELKEYTKGLSSNKKEKIRGHYENYKKIKLT